MKKIIVLSMLLFLLPLAVFSQQLYSPFLPGETWQCAQGNNGSFTHKGTTGKYGLYYSWDFSLSGLPGDLCRPVLASATGIVKNIAFDGSLGSHYGGGSAGVILSTSSTSGPNQI